MLRKARLSAMALFLAVALPLAAQAGSDASLLASIGVQDGNEAAPVADPAVPLHMDKDLAREHELFSNFAHSQVVRMNATIIGGRQNMRIQKGSDGLYHASFRAIDQEGVVCQVRRSESNPHFYVGNLIYKEQILESVGKSPDACRKGPFEPVSEKANRLIYTSQRGGGWH
jgi:hypothetical protein